MNDNINRQQALDTIRNIIAITGTFDDEILLIDKAEAQTALMMLPPAEPQPRKKGKWILDGHHIKCNRCENSMCSRDREGDLIPKNYCPNCGADMREDEEE